MSEAQSAWFEQRGYPKYVCGCEGFNECARVVWCGGVWCVRSAGHNGFLWGSAQGIRHPRTKLPATYCLRIQRMWWDFWPPSSSAQAKWDPGNMHLGYPRPSQSQPAGMPSPGGRKPQPPFLPGRKPRAGLRKPSFGEDCWLPLGSSLPFSESCPCFAGSGLEIKCHLSGMWLWRLARVAVTHTQAWIPVSSGFKSQLLLFNTDCGL